MGELCPLIITLVIVSDVVIFSLPSFLARRGLWHWSRRECLQCRDARYKTLDIVAQIHCYLVDVGAPLVELVDCRVHLQLVHLKRLDLIDEEIQLLLRRTHLVGEGGWSLLPWTEANLGACLG